ncbi:unnamed protein product [Cylicocyclus nassatus]|uniref:Acid phosphatase n=1 Tax=Cylicocyclus nassatus TaxID=53992 RepID=A0AA36MBJ2_CYLNA|nr:unnamed protein product [Cylicocyclus nassatus]
MRQRRLDTASVLRLAIASREKTLAEMMSLVPLFLFALSSPTISAADDMKLQLVQVIWRHGDRTPTLTHRTDPIKEDDWKLGGEGWGQLTPTGMKQHFNFGKQLRKRYVDSGFLSERYNAKEIYIRATDYNRTVISAMSNLLGMYTYNNTASVKGTDYPDVEGWPDGFIPIAVHTIDHHIDNMLIPHNPCNRMNWLFEMLRNKSDEVKGYINRADVQEVFAYLTEKAGEGIKAYNQSNIWEVRDTLKIEQVHFPERLRNECTWYSDELYTKIAQIADKISLFDNGIFEHGPVIINDLDMGLELRKIRGGPVTNDVNMRMYMKYDCLNRQHEPQCRWIKNLKYHVYSCHDTTIFALLTVLGIESKVVVSGSYPDYASAAFVELYTNAAGEPYFKILYRTSDVEDEIYSVTQFIDGCDKKEYCKLEVFDKYAKGAKPDLDIMEWCEVNPWGSPEDDSSSTNLMHITLAFILIAHLWSLS